MENNNINNVMEAVKAVQELIDKANEYDRLKEAYDALVIEHADLEAKYENMDDEREDYEAFKELFADYGSADEIRETLEEFCGDDYEVFKELMEDYDGIDDIKDKLEAYDELKEKVADFVYSVDI